MCDGCGKWRRIPAALGLAFLTDNWQCADNHWESAFAACDAAEDLSEYPVPVGSTLKHTQPQQQQRPLGPWDSDCVSWLDDAKDAWRQKWRGALDRCEWTDDQQDGAEAAKKSLAGIAVRAVGGGGQREDVSGARGAGGIAE